MTSVGPGQPQKELIRAQNGTYEVTKPLATGTFGSIYKVKRESDGKFFAVKCEALNMKSSVSYLWCVGTVLEACLPTFCRHA